MEKVLPSIHELSTKGMLVNWFANIREDLKTYQGDWTCQGFWVMAVYRFGRWRYAISNPFLRKPFSFLYKVMFKAIQILTGTELPCEVAVGRGFRIDHCAGIVISGFASFGEHCVLRNGVTVGLRRVTEPSAPQVGNYVDIGAGAKILGNITIGDHVTVGANAVVLEDVPSHSIAVGVPAQIVKRSGYEL